MNGAGSQVKDPYWVAIPLPCYQQYEGRLCKKTAEVFLKFGSVTTVGPRLTDQIAGKAVRGVAVAVLLLFSILSSTYGSVEGQEPQPPLPFLDSQPLDPRGFTSAEVLNVSNSKGATIYHFTMLRGTSATFVIAVTPNGACSIFRCRPDPPMDLEHHFRGNEIAELVIRDLGDGHREIVHERELPPNTPSRGMEDVVINATPNPVTFGGGKAVYVTVTLTARKDASYGVYRVGLGVRTNGGSYFFSHFFYLTVHTFPLNVGQLYPNERGSDRFGTGGWLRLMNNSTFELSYDGKSRQKGWWAVKQDQLLLALPDITLRGKINEKPDYPRGLSLALEDGSIWTIICEGCGLISTLPQWENSEPFSPVGLASKGRRSAGPYEVYEFEIPSGTSARLGFTVRPSRFAMQSRFPLALDLILEGKVVMGDYVNYNSTLEGVSITITPNPISLEAGESKDITATITAKAGAPDRLYMIRFLRITDREAFQKAQSMGHNVYSGGESMSTAFYLRVRNVQRETELQVFPYVLAGVLVATMALIVLLVRKSRRV